MSKNSKKYCGETGIRTLGTLTGTTVFETAPFNHSGISPVNNSSLLLYRPIQSRLFGTSLRLYRPIQSRLVGTSLRLSIAPFNPDLSGHLSCYIKLFGTLSRYFCPIQSRLVGTSLRLYQTFRDTFPLFCPIQSRLVGTSLRLTIAPKLRYFSLKCKDFLGNFNIFAVYFEISYSIDGKMQEWLNWLAWKAGERETVPWVRIPLFPPLFTNCDLI